MSPGVPARQLQRLVEVLVFYLSPVCQMQLLSKDVAFLVQSLSCSLNIHIWIVLNFSLLDLILSFRLSVPGRRSLSCVCSKVTILCGMVSFTTGLKGRVDRSRFSVISGICIVCVGIVKNLFVGVTVCLTTGSCCCCYCRHYS